VPPKLDVRITGPSTRRVGEIAEYFIDVTNSGSTAATGVIIEAQYAASLQFDRASSNGRSDDLARRTTRWQVGDLASGQTIRKQLHCRCLAPDEAGTTLRVNAVSEQVKNAQPAEARTVIAPDPMASRPPVAPPAAGGLKVMVGDLFDPIMIGGKTTIVVSITNERTVADENVAITIEVPDGLQITASSGPTDIARVAPDRRSVEITPVAEVMPGETLVYKIDCTGTAAGKHTARATVKSTRSPAGVTGTSETTVNRP
jgi:uncharacterized repeat protein (TIGR01451 family)